MDKLNGVKGAADRLLSIGQMLLHLQLAFLILCQAACAFKIISYPVITVLGTIFCIFLTMISTMQGMSVHSYTYNHMHDYDGLEAKRMLGNQAMFGEASLVAFVVSILLL